MTIVVEPLAPARQADFLAFFEGDASRIGEITCFVVAKAHRRTGVARGLLEAACEGLRAQGLEIAEAMPKAQAGSDAENHYGPRSLYESAGFTEHRRTGDGLVIMRRRLV